MLQDIPPPTLSETCPCVLDTERLSLRSPTLADVKAIARLANDRRIAENTRRLPHPYLEEHAIDFCAPRGRFERRGRVFLIEHNFEPIARRRAFTSAKRISPNSATGARLREHWGQGFGIRNRTRGDRLFLRGVRPRVALCAAPASPTRCRATSSAEVRLPGGRRRAAPLRGAGLVEPGRLLPPVAQRVVVAEELGERGKEVIRHCERSEAIHLSACGTMDCFVACAPRNDE